MKIKVFDSNTLKNIIEINLALVTKIQNECIIGRSPESGIVLDSPDVSRMHGKLVLENGNYYFCDLGSRNGSLINGIIAETTHKYLLNPGDTIRLGEFVLILEEVNLEPENIAETVYRNFDATVVASLRDRANSNQLNQTTHIEQVPEFVNNIPEEVTNYQEVTKVQIEEISASEDVIETPAETSPVLESLSQPIEIIEVADHSDNISRINEPESIISNTEPSLKLNVSEQINEVANALEIPEVSLTTSENIVATNEDIVESNITDIHEAEIFEEEITTVATTPIVVEVDRTVEGTTIQPREEIPRSETSDALFSLEANGIYEPEITPLKVPEVLVSNIQPLETTNYTNIVEEFQPAIPMTSDISKSEEDSSSDASVIDYTEITDSSLITVSAQISEEVEIKSTDDTNITDVTNLESSELKEEKTTDSEKAELISTKYIALLAHDSKRFEIAQFVTQHQDFFSKCLTIAPPSVSEILSSQAGIKITEQTSAATSGGYQAIAAKVASGEILAVLFLRDFLQVQSSTANEEAMLRVCNINQVMVATNLSTAEAIVGYIQVRIPGSPIF